MASVDAVLRDFPAMDGEILIAGAGIGGLTTALSLHQAGYDVRVFESVDEVRPLGVGINLLPHAVRELEALGVREPLEAAGIATGTLAYHSAHGAPIWSELRGIDAGYQWPQISLHRGTLQMALLAEATERIGADRIHLGHHIEGYDADDEGVTARFVDRSGRPVAEPRGRILIGADGIHSAVRSLLYPGEGGPKWNGAIMWRGVVEGDAFLDGRTMIMAGHTRQKFVAYPIAQLDGGRQLLNFVAELRFDRTDLAEREDWNRPGSLADVLPAFETWDFGWLDCPDLLRRTPGVWEYPMVDRDPLPQWSFGPVTLLGDAAHPMYPIGSNGASQAILDARALTGCLRSHPDDPEKALIAYDEARRPATAQIVLANRGQGPEEAMQLVHDRAPDGFDDLSDVISDEELTEIAERYKRIAGFAIAELNTRPSLADVDY
jgi:5-methylphenazine-1-carboxylate 1-monooxygenase